MTAQSLRHWATPEEAEEGLEHAECRQKAATLYGIAVSCPKSTASHPFHLWCPFQKRISLTIKHNTHNTHNTGFQSKPGTLTSRLLTRHPPGGHRCPTTRCRLCHGSSNCPDPGLTPRSPTYRQALKPDFPWRLGSSVARNAPGQLPYPPASPPNTMRHCFPKGQDC